MRHGPARWDQLRSDERGRDRASAAGLLLLGAVMVAVGLVDLWPDLGGDTTVSRWWHLVPLAAGCAAVLGKRRHPHPALAVGVVAAVTETVWLGGSVGMVLVLFDLLYAAALYGSPRSRRWLVTTIGLLVVGSFAGGLAAGEGLRVSAFLVLQVFALLGTPVWWATNVRQKTELAAALAERAELERERADGLEELAALREADAVRDERTRTARDLHDAVAGHLSAIAIHAEAALVAPRDPDGDRVALELVRASGIAALREMRSMIVVLRSGAEPAAGASGLDRIDELVTGPTAGSIEVSVRVEVPDDLPVAVDHAAYRIVQESLTNAAQHAPGCRATIDVARLGDALDVVVENTLGTPAAPGARRSVPGGHGIAIMRERAVLLGGSLDAGTVDPAAPGDDTRWRVRALLPLDGVTA